MFIVEVFVNDVENTILDLELKADAEYFKKQIQEGSFQPIKTAQLEAIYLPKESFVAVFRGNRDRSNNVANPWRATGSNQWQALFGPRYYHHGKS